MSAFITTSFYHCTVLECIFYPFFLSFYLFYVSFTSCMLFPFISSSFKSTLLPTSKIKQNLRGKNLKISSWKLRCDTVSHTAKPSVHASLLVRVHCRVIGLVKASGFYYTIHAGPSLELLVGSLLFPVLWRSISFGSVGQVPAPCSSRW